MKTQLTSLSLQYTANFRTPFFRIGDARSAVIEALYRALASYGVTPADMLGFGGGSLEDHRVRINLFRGNAFVEVTARRIHASFANAIGRADGDIIEDCIRRVVSAMEVYSSDAPLGSEQVVLNPTFEMESEEARNAFLRSLSVPPKLPAFVSACNATVWPSYKIELEHPEKEWIIDIGIQRAWFIPKNLFVNVHADFASGANSEKLKEKSQLVVGALDSVLQSLDLQRS